jgi:hypothetical protein
VKSRLLRRLPDVAARIGVGQTKLVAFLAIAALVGSAPRA